MRTYVNTPKVQLYVQVTQFFRHLGTTNVYFESTLLSLATSDVSIMDSKLSHGFSLCSCPPLKSVQRHPVCAFGFIIFPCSPMA